MNSTFLSQRHLQDITVLRGLDVTLRPWDLKLSDHLEGFADAIDLCTSIIAVPSDDGTNFGLSDAAYILSSAGTLWSRRVDDMVRTAQRTLDTLSDLDKSKKRKNGPGDANSNREKDKTRKRLGHPLALIPDAVKGPQNFIPKREPRRIPTSHCVLKDVPSLSPEDFLAQVYPGSLPLLDCERIRSYIDERGNKGLDWAEFRINSLKMNRDGFFPLRDVNSERIHQQYDQGGFQNLSLNAEDGGAMGNSDYDVEKAASIEIADTEDKPPSDQPAAEVHHFTAPPIGFREPHKPRTITSASAEADEPFLRFLNIDALKLERKLKAIEAIPDNIPTESAFRRRNKRVMKEQQVQVVSSEVGFFMNFWDIFTPDNQPKILLKAVVNRFRWRLKAVEVTVPIKKSRGRAKKVVKTVTFISRDGNGDVEGNLPGVETVVGEGALKPEAIADEALVDDDMLTDADNYIELDEPIGGDDAVQLDAVTDFFAQMIKDPRRRLSVFPIAENHRMDEDSDFDGDSSFVLPVDLHEWEAKLNEFLKTHEATTSNFNLGTYGANMISQHLAQSGGETRPMSDLMGAKKSAGDVCRAFLSILDLTNKNLLSFNSETDESAAQTGSRDFQDVALNVCLNAKKMAKFANGQK